MNEQLKKVILDATKVETNSCGYCGQTEYVEPEEHSTSQAKLLRVIELLVQQRDELLYSVTRTEMDGQEGLDAELIAALETK